MLSADTIARINEQFQQLLPEHLIKAKAEFDTISQAALTDILSRLDLVSREEFDVQAKLLERALEKLSRLEQQLNQLEQDNSI